MGATWLSIRVELIGGRGQRFWPRPGRLFAASQHHSFAALATAIDEAYGRWDRAHLHEFTLADGRRAGGPFDLWDEADDMLDCGKTKLSTLQPGDRFAYVFDFGDDWTHLCTVAPKRIDPHEVLGVTPEYPMPYFGWGDLPDQYGRRFEDDDGEVAVPADPKGMDLPDFLRHWTSP